MTRRVSKHGTTCECGCGTPVSRRFVSGHNAQIQRRTAFEDSYHIVECGYVTACWVCRWKPNKTGYCLLSLAGKRDYAHRHSYRRLRGEIPDGLELDHLCRNTRCMNPDHLEPVTRAINALRARKSMCLRGHDFTPENTRIRPNGKRACRKCDAIHARRTNEKRKVARRALL